MKLEKVTTFSAVLLALLLVGCAASATSGEAAAPEASGEPVELRFQEWFAPGDSYADATQAYADAVTEATNGQVTFDLFWSSSIASSDEVAGALEDALIDLGRIQPPASPADYPITNWMARLHTETSTEPAGLLQGIGAHLELAMETAALEEELAGLGIAYIAPLALVPNYSMLCRDPIETLDDASGMSVRVAGEAWVAEAENLGMEPVTLLPEEIYEGYQRGVVDCVMTYPTHWVDSGLWELGGYHVPVRLTGWNQDAIVISAEVWDGMSAETKSTLQEQTRVWIESFVQSQLELYWQFVTEAGDHDVTLQGSVPELQAQVDDYHARLRAEMVATAPASLDNPEAIIERHAELHDKWEKIVEEFGFVVGDEVTMQDWVESLEDPQSPPDIDLDPWLDRVMVEVFG